MSERTCDFCGRSLEGTAPQRRYCCRRCQGRAYRHRHRPGGAAERRIAELLAHVASLREEMLSLSCELRLLRARHREVSAEHLRAVRELERLVGGGQ